MVGPQPRNLYLQSPGAAMLVATVVLAPSQASAISSRSVKVATKATPVPDLLADNKAARPSLTAALTALCL
eukprot:3311398-Lingulodinium_polyedra.AAC.1